MVLCALFSAISQADGLKKKPVVYLTFDDGPSSDLVTEMVLNVLAKHDAKATFFVTGARARANPEKIRKIVDAGHAVGNHTYSHSHLTSLFDHEVAKELNETSRYVYAAGGPTMTCFRAPFGNTNQRVNDIAMRMGMHKVGWSIDTRDWDVFVDPEQIAIQLEDSQNGSIVLMHDGPQSRWRTLEVFTRWIEDTAGTYSFEVLPECAHRAETYASVDLPIATGISADVGFVADAYISEAYVSEPMAQNVVADLLPEVAKRPLAVVTAHDDLTLPKLLEKLRSYEISLLPEVVAQNGVKKPAQF